MELDSIPKYKVAKKHFERRYTADCLARAKGNVSQAARLAGKDRKDFYKLMERTGLNPEDFR